MAWSFFRTGLRNTYGLGRSGRSKVLPMILLAMMLLPALILVGVLVQARDVLDLDQQLVAYSRYPVITQALISVFVAAQAPALISRDLRFRTITLYLARPMQRSVYVLVRFASLTVATFILIGAPLLLMYAGGLLADLSVGRETRDFLGGMFGAALLAALLSGLAAVVAALTVRRGLAVAAVIVVLVVSYTAVSTIQGIATGTGDDTVGEVAGLFSPYTLVNGVQVFLFDAPNATVTPPDGTAMGLVYVAGRAAHRGRLAGRPHGPLPDGPAMSEIRIDHVSRWYRNVVAVNDVSMTIGPGVTGLLGPNGAGKTTLIAMMSGFLAPSTGTVTLDGEPLWRNEEVYRKIGLVPEREALFDYLTGRQFVVAMAELHGLADAGAAAQRAIAKIEMTDAQDREISTYSKGMRQRIKMASALVHDPAVLLLDEPFNGMDPRQRIHLMELLRTMGAEGRTVLFSSHILEEVEQVARQIEVMVVGAARGVRRLRRDPAADDRPAEPVRAAHRRRPADGVGAAGRPVRARRAAARRRAASSSRPPTSAGSARCCRGWPASTGSGCTR